MNCFARSLTFYAALIFAFVACSTEAKLRAQRRTSADKYVTLSSYEGTDIQEIEAEIQVITDELETPEDPDVPSMEEEERANLEMLAYQYEEVMVQAADLETNARYELGKAKDQIDEGATDGALQVAIDQASKALKDALAEEEEIADEEDKIKNQMQGMIKEAESRRRELKEKENHLNQALKDIQEHAEYRRLKLDEELSSQGKESATLNGITYEVQWS